MADVLIVILMVLLLAAALTPAHLRSRRLSTGRFDLPPDADERRARADLRARS